VWCKQFFGRNFFVVEKSVGGFEFCSSSESGGNADVGTIAKVFENIGKAFVEAVVFERGGGQFVGDPGGTQKTNDT
jgi:hypothetical protein